MTDEKRIEEIRARRGGYLYNEDSSLGYWASRDVDVLLAALDAERAAHAETRAETVRYGADINRAIADGANHLHDSEAKRVAQQTRIVELERALVDMRFTACAVLVWACDSHPDTVTAVRTVKALAEAYVEATAQRDAERARAVRAEAAMSDVADFLAWEENKWIATGDSVPDAVRKVVLGLRAERGRAMDLAEREVADALVRSKERTRRVYWTDYTTGEPYETGGDWPASEISVANEVCGFFRMLRMWTLEMRANRAEADRDARPAITPELAIRFLAHETDPGVFRKVTDAVADFGTAMVERAAKSRPSPARCEICDWPLHDTIDKGCTAESCSYRPEFGSEEHRRIAARRKEIAEKAGGGT